MQTDEIVSQLRAGIYKYGHERIELEFRLGHRVLGRFEPGVPCDAWERVKAALDAASKPRADGAAPAFARTETRTLERIHNGHKHVVDEAGNVTGVHKKRLSDVDLQQAGPWDIRASVSLEETETPSSAPPESAFERRKHRWVVRHTPRGALCGSRQGMAESRQGMAESRQGMAESRQGMAESRQGMAESRLGLCVQVFVPPQVLVHRPDVRHGQLARTRQRPSDVRGRGRVGGSRGIVR
jgi:hypothetical protein